MSFHLTDDQLHALVARDPSDPKLLKELRLRVRWNALKAMPARRGRCGHGKRVYADEKGAMASGYICHEGHGICGNGGGVDVVWNEDPKRARLKALVETIPR